MRENEILKEKLQQYGIKWLFILGRLLKRYLESRKGRDKIIKKPSSGV